MEIKRCNKCKSLICDGNTYFCNDLKLLVYNIEYLPPFGHIKHIYTNKGTFQAMRGGRYCYLDFKPALEVFDKQLIQELNNEISAKRNKKQKKN